MCGMPIRGNTQNNILDRLVSIDLTDSNLEKVFDEITTQTALQIFYNVDKIKNTPVKNLNVKNVSLKFLLESLLPKNNLSYTIKDGIIVIKSVNNRTEGLNQEKLLRGVITDMSGELLPEAFIVDKKTKKGVITNTSGQFEISIPTSSDTIIVSFLGMKTAQIDITNKSWIEVRLQEDRIYLDQIVFTGYQSISRERTAGSFALINKETINKGGVTDLTSRIEGMAPGLSVYKGDVRVRGVSTLRGKSTPLYVVDGFPLVGNIDDINPKDIQSITLLKDASAASIYGAQAANGVIVITTLKGGTGKPTITYEGSYNYTPIVDFDLYNLSSTSELVNLEVESFDRYFSRHPWNVVKSQRVLNTKVYDILYKEKNGTLTQEEAKNQIDMLRNSDNRSQIKKYILQPQQVHQHNLSLSGGTDRESYYVSGVYTGTNETLRGNKNEKVNLNIRTDFKLNKRLKLNLGSNLNIYKGTHNAVAGNMLQYPSYEMLKDEQGNDIAINYNKPYYEIQRLLGRNLYDESYYPLQENDKVDISSKRFSTRNYIALNYKVIDGLSLEGRYQFERGSSVNSNYYSESSNTSVTMINNFAQIDGSGTIKFNIPYGGQKAETRGDHFSQTIRFQANYDKNIMNNKHIISAIAGAERRKITTSSTTLQKFGFNNKDNTYTPIDASSLGFIFGTESIWGYSFYNETQNNRFVETDDRYVSFYGNASYTYNNNLSFTGSVRIDQSNLWGTDPSVQYKPLWSLGTIWRLSEESFFNASWINRLNIRLSHGINGNIPKDTGPYVRLSPFYSSNLFLHGYYVSSPPNYNLTWERTAISNFGIDISVLKNRISGTIELYNKNTTDLLGPISTDPTQGFQSVIVNYGSMYNRGIELGLFTQNIERENFSWNSSLNFSYNKNKMTEITNSVLAVSAWAGRTAHVVGEPYGSVYAYKWAGLSSTGEPQVYNEKGEVVQNSSNVKSIDALTSVGSLIPKYSGGFENFIRYKNFGLSFLFVFNGGNVFKKDVPSIQGTPQGLTSNYNKSLNNRWKAPGDESKTDVPKFNISPDNVDRSNLYQASEQHWVSGDFIKLRNIELSYSLPKHFLNTLLVRSATVKFFATNIFCVAKNKEGLDPEMFSTEGYRYPIMPSYTLSLNVSF